MKMKKTVFISLLVVHFLKHFGGKYTILEITLKLKHLIFGYKIFDKKYYGVNYFITILGNLE